MEIPKRTNATQLSDDELLLFDFLFDKTLSFHHLRIADYSFHMNCSYSHHLNDGELLFTLESLVDRGLLHRKFGQIWDVGANTCSEGFRYTLTENGGKLWELERQPVWDRYVETSHWELGANCRGMMRVVCKDESTALICLGMMFAAGLVSPVGRIRIRDIWNARLLPWKSFGRVKSVRCKTNDSVYDERILKDWDVYNQCRTWWRTVHELDTLKK